MLLLTYIIEVTPFSSRDMPFQPSTGQTPQQAGNGLAGAVTGAALALLGGAVAAGWVLRLPALVQLLPGLTPMVLNTSACFVLAGVVLMLAALRPARRRAVRVLSAVLLALAAAVTLQYVLGADFGIDAPALHAWLRSEGNPHPGRMSAFTGLAFITASLAMLLAAGPSRPRIDSLAVALATATGVVGALALVGYLFQLHLVYARYPLGLVALHTAVGLVALSLALWLQLLREGRVHSWNRLAPQDRIALASAAVLALATLAVAVSVFATLQVRVTQALSDGLAASLRYRVLLAKEIIDAGAQRSRILVGRPAPARLLKRYKQHPGDAEAVDQLSQSAASLIDNGYRAGIYYDADGREIVRAGEPLRDPSLVVELRGIPGATLAWQGRFVITGRYPIVDADGPLGAARVDTPLPALDALLNDSYRLGASGEAGMCARAGERLGCFPQPRIPKVYFVPIKAADGTPLPMSRGVAGETGVVLTQDYRGENVMAAYAPVGDFGLAMVTKMDTAEIYAPVRERLQFAVPLLLLLIGAGTFLVRISVQPLAERLARSEREAQERHGVLDAMMDKVADGMMMLDADGTIRSWNAAAERLFGYVMAEVVGRNVSILLPEELRQSNIASTGRFLATGQSNVIDQGNLNYPARRKDGSRFEAEFAITRMGGGKTPQLVAVFRDITERKQAELRLSQLALHDALTGLPNRASFEQRITDALARHRRSGGQLALMVLDLDNFKKVNDSLGHAAGDFLLVAFAKRLQGALRESDLVARLGGDEFTIIAEGLKDAGDAAAIADKIVATMRDPIDIDGRPLSASTSIGVALCRDADTPQTLIQRADKAMYEAKGRGRARYCLAD
ncbi:MAG TPA: diguanylate cyclase [Burkholderiales bacterium]|nr:diguanylate cyclase [Burkholderiales bacterium]